MFERGVFRGGRVTASPDLLASLLAPADASYAYSPSRQSAYFVPEATAAEWDGEILTVTFREVGLPAGATTTVSVAGEGVAEAVCGHDDEVYFSLHSHSAATDESAYPVAPDGSADSTVVLRLGAQVAFDGLDCTAAVSRSFSVTVRDLDTGASVYVSGPATSCGANASRSGLVATSGSVPYGHRHRT